MNLIPNFKPENIVQSIENITKKGFEVVSSAEKGGNWDEVITATDNFECELGRLTSVNSHLNAVMFSDEFNTQYEQTLPIITNFYSDISSNKALYTAYKNLKNTDLNEQQQHILQESIDGFELSGVGLEGEDSKRFKAIKEQLSLLSNQFSKNSLKATNEWIKIVELEELKGYSETELAKIKTDKGYELNLQMPVYMDVMTYLDNRELREEVYRAYASRASEVGITSVDFDNKAIMDEILALRQEMADILGFKNYAQLSIESKMVESVDQILEFLTNLVQKSKSQAQAEFDELSQFAGIVLQPWDLGFYSEQLKAKKFGFKKSDLTPYFPEQKVLEGLFSTIESLYKVKVQQIDESSYHNDVRVLEITSNNQLIGKIYLDLYARKDKRGGAWMADYQPLIGNEKPIAFVVCNLNSPSKGKPALFEFDEIVTIFHEFGHALHHVLTKVKYPCAAGISGVPWDGVELPSQYMEFFCYERSVIDKMSEHVETQKSLPDELYNKLIASKNFQSAMGMLRQCEFSLWDLQTHLGKCDTYEVLTQVRQQTALMSAIDENRFLNTFGHVFSGGYAAGYFSYKWAEVLAADAYYYVQEHGGIGSDASLDFLHHILETGGSQDFMDSYKAFRGKKPEINALLQANGIVI
ncbi:M3 family metallopeptidase [Candidatus Thioglobus sp.]|mgnify:CR=1 FL=1|jgi:oligopeptidase A|uniref:M3 family metallopeptidase n=1 Tax=Candidatus Thioglobus sp. TaxID=2026721 RepID=UPI001D731DF2|nr:M3 family metallopeptidase [Candidatus Thioglobus sp.]MBT3276532.1 M3 family metallopeptidase [Candidatus Thioglobus sp.]MBT3446639.1 M3 family metallopeptidase [Candidatus Thioglobus sp.]MBT3744979.1 M3 family metallopeptidase [Candidatus Thioglobus sp.]MBT4001042.1 M3 family metallopeptidase [Candidatus Thioglobus sp.]MBT4421925.1 M3 family metallopeptidase [Candidatus Thioglobus sp.]